MFVKQWKIRKMYPLWAFMNAVKQLGNYTVEFNGSGW